MARGPDFVGYLCTVVRPAGQRLVKKVNNAVFEWTGV